MRHDEGDDGQKVVKSSNSAVPDDVKALHMSSYLAAWEHGVKELLRLDEEVPDTSWTRARAERVAEGVFGDGGGGGRLRFPAARIAERGASRRHPCG